MARPFFYPPIENPETMPKLVILRVCVAAVALFAAQPPAAAADAVAGEAVFKKCAVCHSLEKGTNKVGPSLYGLIGRTAGTAAKFKYSMAMKAAGEGGIAWTEENLLAYLEAPKTFVPKNKMPFPGLRKAKDRDDLIAYLNKATR